MEILQSDKLADVAYDVRGPVLDEAMRLEHAGHQLLKLNIGNPATFGFEAPEDIIRDVIRNLPASQGYSDAKGLFSARKAVQLHYEGLGVPDIDVDDIYLGNGVSELITLSLQALLNDGDEVLVPAPDYPLWTAVVSLCGGTPVHYLCDETQGWQPDLDDIASKITPRTRALAIINPNNPTGAVYTRETLEALLEIARLNDLVVFSDEIYDRILYDDAEHVVTASLADDVLCVTFGGLSKVYRVAGFRSGWAVVSGPRQHARSYVEGLNILTNMRLCANVPAQHAIQTALGGAQSVAPLLEPGGRLREQRDRAWELLNKIPGVSCVKPRGALYVFPRLDPEVYPITDDERFVLDLLRSEHMLLVQGSGFHWPQPDHLRMITLPPVDVLDDAVGRLARFLEAYRAA